MWLPLLAELLKHVLIITGHLTGVTLNPAKDVRVSRFNTQARAQGFKTRVLQELHCFSFILIPLAQREIKANAIINNKNNNSQQINSVQIQCRAKLHGRNGNILLESACIKNPLLAGKLKIIRFKSSSGLRLCSSIPLFLTDVLTQRLGKSATVQGQSRFKRRDLIRGCLNDDF